MKDERKSARYPWKLRFTFYLQYMLTHTALSHSIGILVAS